MVWSIRFAYFELFYGLIPLLCCALWYRLKRYKEPIYTYSLAGFLKKEGVVKPNLRRLFFIATRFIILMGLAFLIARPQRVDEQSKVVVEGIDIMMVLDVSGSMQIIDDPQTRQERIEIAKIEAIKFIKKRDNDPIGLVLFGKEAASRCPLTLDKTVLESIVKEIELGVVDANGTVLSKGLITALGRLKKSEAKTKIIIVLTDGEPTPGDLHPDDVILLAKKYGVKIYTIGIGSASGGYLQDQFGGLHRNLYPARVNIGLLEKLARSTGGKAFLASNQQELANIYDTIDQLEKTEYETDVYQNYHDIFMPFLLALALLFLFEQLLATFVWFGL